MQDQSNFCVPTALSILSGKSKQECLYALARARARVEGTTRVKQAWNRAVYIPAARDLGIPVAEPKHYFFAQFKKYLNINYISKYMPELATGTWLIRGSRHLYVLKNGILYDSIHPNGVHPRATRKRFNVEHAWKVG